MTKNRCKWAAPGDVNAFFGLMLDNIAGLLLAVGLLYHVFEFPTTFSLRHMVPGTAIGVFVGDLLYFFMALRLAARTGRNNTTAMPLGLDTPSTFGMVFFVLGPAFLHAKNVLQLAGDSAAQYAWHIGICSIFISGVFKFACAVGSGWIRRMVPRASLLGSLAAIALVLISFLPLIEVLHHPAVGLVALAVILTTLVGRVPLPFRFPGALGGLIVAGAMYYGMLACDASFGTELLAGGHAAAFDPASGLWPTEWLTVFRFEWLNQLADTVPYLPIVIPLALGTVVGGIDCTESAASVGDEYHTGRVIAVEAFATLAAALCGGVIQTTPYIGHPAYKAMGGRAAYTLATALFVGSAGVVGYFGYMYMLIPKVTVYPILVFVGLEITGQSFLHTPRRHYTAVALACVPALAALALIYIDKIFGDPALFAAKLGIAELKDTNLKLELATVRMLANGFIVTSLLWSAGLASAIDRRLYRAAAYYGLAALFTCFGIMHSPLPGSPVFLPWQLAAEPQRLALQFAAGYAMVALLMLAWGAYLGRTGVTPIDSDEEFERTSLHEEK